MSNSIKSNSIEKKRLTESLAIISNTQNEKNLEKNLENISEMNSEDLHKQQEYENNWIDIPDAWKNKRIQSEKLRMWNGWSETILEAINKSTFGKLSKKKFQSKLSSFIMTMNLHEVMNIVTQMKDIIIKYIDGNERKMPENKRDFNGILRLMKLNSRLLLPVIAQTLNLDIVLLDNKTGKITQFEYGAPKVIVLLVFNPRQEDNDFTMEDEWNIIGYELPLTGRQKIHRVQTVFERGKFPIEIEKFMNKSSYLMDQIEFIKNNNENNIENNFQNNIENEQQQIGGAPIQTNSHTLTLNNMYYDLQNQMGHNFSKSERKKVMMMFNNMINQK